MRSSIPSSILHNTPSTDDSTLDIAQGGNHIPPFGIPSDLFSQRPSSFSPLCLAAVGVGIALHLFKDPLFYLSDIYVIQYGGHKSTRSRV